MNQHNEADQRTTATAPVYAPPVVTPHGTLELSGPNLGTLRFSAGGKSCAIKRAPRRLVEAAVKHSLAEERKLKLKRLGMRSFKASFDTNDTTLLVNVLTDLSSKILAAGPVPGISQLLTALMWNAAIAQGKNPRSMLLEACWSDNMDAWGNAPSEELLLSGLTIGWKLAERWSVQRGYVTALVSQIVRTINPEVRLLGHVARLSLRHADETRNVKRLLAISFPGLRGSALGSVTARSDISTLKIWYKGITQAVQAAGQVMKWGPAKQRELINRLFTDLIRKEFDPVTFLAAARKAKDYQESQDEGLVKMWEETGYNWELSSRHSYRVLQAVFAEALNVHLGARVPNLDLQTGHDNNLTITPGEIAGHLASLLVVAERPEELFAFGAGQFYAWGILVDATRMVSEAFDKCRIYGMPPELKQHVSGRGFISATGKGSIREIETITGEACKQIQKLESGGTPVPMASCQPDHPLHRRLRGLWEAAGRGERALDMRASHAGITLTQRLVMDTGHCTRTASTLRHCMATYNGRAVDGRVLLVEYVDDRGNPVLSAELEVENFEIVQLQGLGDVKASAQERELAEFMLGRCGLREHSKSRSGSVRQEPQFTELALPEGFTKTAWRYKTMQHQDTPNWGYERERITAAEQRRHQAVKIVAEQVMGKHAQDLQPCEVYGFGLPVRMGKGSEQLRLMRSGGARPTIQALHHTYQTELREGDDGKRRALEVVEHLGKEIQSPELCLLMDRPVLRLRGYGPIGIGGRIVHQGSVCYLEAAVHVRKSYEQRNEPINLQPLTPMGVYDNRQHTLRLTLRQDDGNHSRKRYEDLSRALTILKLRWRENPQSVEVQIRELRIWAETTLLQLKQFATAVLNKKIEHILTRLGDPAEFPTEMLSVILDNAIWNPEEKRWDDVFPWEERGRELRKTELELEAAERQRNHVRRATADHLSSMNDFPPENELPF